MSGLHPGAGLRVGIVGGGFMARTHAHAARVAGAEVTSLLSSSPESTARAAHQLGTAPARSLEELIDRVDVVHVCTPNALHLPQSLAALDAGRHVVCEKPLATSAADADALAARAGESRRVATVPFVYRFHPMVREARARVRSGGIGRLFTLRGEYLQDWMLGVAERNWRVDAAVGGRSRAFADIGSHLVDLLEFVIGERIVRVAARTSTAHEERDGERVHTEDAAAVVVETSGGAIGTVLVSQVAAGRKNALSFEVSGAEGAVAFAQETPDELWWGRADGSVTIPRDDALLSPDAARLSVVPAGHPMGYLDAFSAFARDSYAAIRGEAPDGLPRFADGARAAAVTEAVLAAARSDGWESVDSTPDAVLEGAMAASTR
ncbi:Gfo/Idh/MocA family oxidoreductase [Microbacterium paludicola]|uniref:Gfo/Idh/MocA family protein n=1 Tax=Microbacterium paludicola TaxID=300019 RepID=UPI0028D80444|nr:Gfo/Idh/MocA family oxidoreductase [Microbacterium paludicola]